MGNKHSKAPVGQAFAISVRGNNVDQALRALKKKMQRDGAFGEMRKASEGYMGPAEKKRVKHEKAVDRQRRKADKKAASELGMGVSDYRKQRRLGLL